MNKPNPALERKVRLEVLRTRAAIERGQMCQMVSGISQSLEPGSLLGLVKRQLGQHFSSSMSSSTSSWLDLLLSSGQRYPILFSGVSALLGTVLGKKKWRFGALALTGWRLFGAYQKLKAHRQERYVQPENRTSSRVIGPLK